MGWILAGLVLLLTSVWINVVSIDKAYIAHRQIGSYGQAQALGALSLIAATLGGMVLGSILVGGGP